MVLPKREDYTNEASEALERAHAWASDMRNAQLDAEHLTLGMLSIKDGMASKVFDLSTSFFVPSLANLFAFFSASFFSLLACFSISFALLVDL